ncbi:MAG: hypothetical protein L0211_03345 [Planctomycetaceae bacterium]|nr:hypothetical protein [Planctomycetaceae bacterium]
MSIDRLPFDDRAVARRSLILAACCWGCAALAGCGGRNYTPPAAADPATARSALEKALDCWRLRITPDELAQAEPAITVSDYDWRDGRRLVEFQILAGEQALGTSVHWPVRLKVVQVSGREQWLDATYIVSTNPIIHISRQD